LKNSHNMATSLKSTHSTYAGFLNGYIAGNLSANSAELHFHSNKIFQFLKELKSEINKWELGTQRKKMDELFESFTGLHISDNNIEGYINTGDAIYELISFILSCKPELPSTTSFILKKIIYHYLNIAKTSKNSSVIKQAKRIVEKFEQ